MVVLNEGAGNIGY